MDLVANKIYGQDFPGVKKNLLCGDSVAFAAKPFIDLLPDTFCSALGGNSSSELLRSIKVEILNFKPDNVLIHCGGNDILGGRPIKDIVSNFKEIYKILKECGVKRVGFLEIVPLGRADALHLMNFDTIPRFMQEMKNLNMYEIVPFRYMLQDSDGWLDPKYDNGDHIHHVFPLTQLEVWLPVVAYWLFR